MPSRAEGGKPFGLLSPPKMKTDAELIRIAMTVPVRWFLKYQSLL